MKQIEECQFCKKKFYKKSYNNIFCSSTCGNRYRKMVSGYVRAKRYDLFIQKYGQSKELRRIFDDRLTNDIIKLWKAAFGTLSLVELAVLCNSHFSDTAIFETKTYADIGRIVGLSRERIRQIANTAFRKTLALRRKLSQGDIPLGERGEVNYG